MSYQPDDHNLYYLSATEGFRPGGGEIALAPFCASGLNTLGYADGHSPQSYRSDDVWSYELGAKSQLLGGCCNFPPARIC